MTSTSCVAGCRDGACVLTLDDLPTGPFLARDLLASGWSSRQLKAAVRDVVVRRVLRGVYVRADVPDSIETRARAAALVTSPASVLVDRTAAWLHGIDVLGWHEKEILPPLECFVLRGHRRAERAGVYGGQRDLRDEDTVRLHGVVLTTAVRTALDLACMLPEREGLAVLDQFLHAGLTTKTELERLLPRYFRRRGVVRARWLVAHADALAESPRESWVRYELLRGGLPTPVLQHWVEVDGVARYRLDLSYPRHRVVVEYDGADYHRSLDARARDERRRACLRELGWTVIVLDRDSFVGDGVEQWVRQVRRALDERRSRTSRSGARNWRTLGAVPTGGRG